MTVFRFPTPTPVLPALNGFSVKKKPVFAPTVFQAVSGREFQFSRQAYPLYEFDLTYEILRDQTQNQTAYSNVAPYVQLKQLSEVFLACRGQYGRFYYEDLSDNSRTGQLLGTGDGANVTFPAVRTLGYFTSQFVEPVGAVNTDHTWTVYLNGIDDTVNWSLDSDNVNFVRSSAPSSGVTVTADFYYFWYCRFISDQQDFEEFLTNRWMVKSLKFRSVKN